MKKTKLKFKEESFNDEVDSYGILIPLVNEVIAAYNKIGVPQLVDNEVYELVADPQAVIYDKMTKGVSIELHGFKIDRSKAFDLLEKPKGYDELLTAINAVKSQTSYEWHLSNYTLSGNEVVLKPGLLAKITEHHTVYATNAEHLKALNFGQAVIAAATEHFGEGAIDIPSVVQMIIEPQQSNFRDVPTQPFKLKFDRIATFRDPQ